MTRREWNNLPNQLSLEEKAATRRALAYQPPDAPAEARTPSTWHSDAREVELAELDALERRQRQLQNVVLPAKKPIVVPAKKPIVREEMGHDATRRSGGNRRGRG